MAEVATLQDFTAQLVADLRAENVGFAIVGGLAVSVRTEPRFTSDVDVAIAVRGDAEAEALVRAMQARGYDAFAVLEQTAASRMAMVRMRKVSAGGEALVADLLFASSGVEVELVANATEESLPGIGAVPIATCGFLIALKLLSRREKGRPNDSADVLGLLRAATAVDVAQARAAIALIETRGFHRGRDLGALLDAALLDRDANEAD